MYNIDTASPLLNEFGVGKGAAQVLDMSPLQDMLKQKRAEEFASKQAKLKQEDATRKGIDDELANLGDEVFVRDHPMFLQKQKEIYDYAHKNSDKLNSGDMDAKQGFNSLLNSFHGEAKISNQYGKQWYATNRMMQEGEKAGKKYRQEDKDLIKNASSPDFAGDYDASKIIDPQEDISYMDRVVNKLRPFSESAARDTPYGKTFTLPEAELVVEDDLHSDDSLMSQAEHDFNKAADKKGAKNAVDFYKKVYAPKLVIKDTKAGPSSVSGNGNNVEHVDLQRTDNGDELIINQQKPVQMDINGEKRMVVMNKVLRNAKTGEITGKGTVSLTPDEVAYQKADKKALYEKDYSEWESKNGGTKQAALLSGVPMPVVDDKKYQVQVDRTVDLDYSKVRGIAKTVHGWDNLLKTFQNGEAPEGTDMSVNDIRGKTPGKETQSSWNTKWTALKKGESLVGLDGKKYTKK